MAFEGDGENATDGFEAQIMALADIFDSMEEGLGVCARLTADAEGEALWDIGQEVRVIRFHMTPLGCDVEMGRWVIVCFYVCFYGGQLAECVVPCWR